jgi:hypothetical protein
VECGRDLRRQLREIAEELEEQPRRRVLDVARYPLIRITNTVRAQSFSSAVTGVCELLPADDPTPAVATVVGRGVFVLQERRRFELRRHASSVRSSGITGPVVEAYDPEEMEEALIRRQDEMYARSHEVLERTPGGRARIRGAGDDDTADAGRVAGRPQARPSTP